MHNFNIKVNVSMLNDYGINLTDDITKLSKFGEFKHIPELSRDSSGKPPYLLVFQFTCANYNDKVKELMDAMSMKVDSFWQDGCIHKLKHNAYVTSGNSVFTVLKCSRCNEVFSKNVKEL